MALKALVDSAAHAALPESVRALYRADAGRFILDVEPVGDFRLEDVGGLKTALSAERTKAEQLGAASKMFEGLDPAAAREALKKVGDMAKWTPEEKVREQIEAQTRQLSEKHGRELESANGKAKTYRGQVEKLMVENKALEALGKHAKSPQLLLPHVLGNVRVVEDEKGTLRAVVVDARGNPRITNKTGSTDEMSIEELVESMKADPVYAPAFNPTPAAGTGSGPNGGGGSGGAKTVSRSDPEAVSASIADIAAGKVVVV